MNVHRPEPNVWRLRQRIVILEKERDLGKKENLNNTSRKNKVAIVVFVHNCKQDIYMCTLDLFTPLLMYTKGIQSPY